MNSVSVTHIFNIQIVFVYALFNDSAISIAFRVNGSLVYKDLETIR
jgi:hypothetical protein